MYGTGLVGMVMRLVTVSIRRRPGGAVMGAV